MALPSLREAQSGPLGDLVPVDAKALTAEERSFRLFAFPVLSRTLVAERVPDGMSLPRLGLLAGRVVTANREGLPGIEDAAGALLVSNHLGEPPLVRERGTTALVPLLFETDVRVTRRTRAAERLAVRYFAPPPAGGTLGVTGSIPARAEQADLVEENLGLIEALTLVVVLLTVAVYVRSVVAPIVALLAVAAAFLVAVRLIAYAGVSLGVSVPSEIEPVVVALLFGVVTDYVLFYVGRFRRRLRLGEDPRHAAAEVTAELTPILLACGLAVAAGCGALGVAELAFLRTFGPGTALAVLVGLAVALTLVPALLAILGRALLWPSQVEERPKPATPRQDALLSRIVRRPKTTIVIAVAALLLMATPALWVSLGNPIIQGLPSDSGPHATFDEVQKGFAPGVVAPAVVLVEGPGIVRKREALQQFGEVLDAQAGVAGVVGPGINPFGRPFGVVLAPGGDAARFVLISETDPLGATAIRRLRNLDERLPGIAELVGLGNTQISVAGDTALVGETIEAATDDLLRVVPAVLFAVLLVLVVFLRAIVAPLYLVACAALAPLAATGLTVVLFEWILGSDGITFFVPIAAGVLLVSLGSDYNVFLVGRIWAEARDKPLVDAVVAGGISASRAIAAAALVLAASFAAIALVPVDAFRQLAFLVAVGLLIDGFLVRTVLVPAVIVLVGPASGWPGNALERALPSAPERLARRPASK